MKSPAPPSVTNNGIDEFWLGPSLTAVSANRDLSYFRLPGPGSTKHQVNLVRRHCLMWRRPEDLRLQSDFSERAPHWLPIHIVPVGVIRCLPVTCKCRRYCTDACQPVYRSHGIMTPQNRPHRIAIIFSRVLSVHLLCCQHIFLQRVRCL